MRIVWTPPATDCVFSKSCGIDPCPVNLDLPCEDFELKKRRTQPTTEKRG